MGRAAHRRVLEAIDELGQLLPRTGRNEGYLDTLDSLEEEYRTEYDLDEGRFAATRPTVTVFVKIKGGAFPDTVEGDVWVYRNYEPRDMKLADPNWVMFAEVPILDAPTIGYDETEEEDDG